MNDTASTAADGDAYARPSLDIARDHIGLLLGAFQTETDLTQTFVGNIARGNDPKFARTYLEKDFGFRSYDAVNSRLSAVWPPCVAWPDGVPRLPPARLEADALEALGKRAEANAAKAAEEIAALKSSGVTDDQIAGLPVSRRALIAAELIQIATARHDAEAQPTKKEAVNG